MNFQVNKMCKKKGAKNITQEVSQIHLMETIFGLSFK